MTCSKLLLSAALGLAAASPDVATAEQARSPEVWVNGGLLSYHFQRDRGYRERNWGLGVEAVLTPDHALMLGTYLNSENERSRYAGYQWRPLHWQPGGVRVSAGVAASLVDGYPTMNDRGWFLAAMPMLAVEGRTFGANFLVVPNVKHGGAIAVQLKLNVW